VDKSKLIHDMNSSISAIAQSLALVNDNWKSNPDLVEKILPLLLEKATSLEETWGSVKEIIKE